jgi:hypothetical protein
MTYMTAGFGWDSTFDDRHAVGFGLDSTFDDRQDSRIWVGINL